MFKCAKCGSACCVFRSPEEAPLVFPWEKRALEAKRPGLKFSPRLAYRSGSACFVALYRWLIEGPCPFLTERGLCSIHGEKPLSCKMFPLLLGTDGTLRLSSSCPLVTKELAEEAARDPAGVFPDELPAAARAFAYIGAVEEAARRLGWLRVVDPDCSACECVDVDEVLEVR